MNQYIIKVIGKKGTLNALILRADFQKNGIEFLTSEEEQLQLGYMKRQKDHKIEPHIHQNIQRTISNSSECLFIKSGSVKIYFYETDKSPICEHIVKEGDVVLLLSGGHGFLMLETSEIIEAKQGPYVGETDKLRFTDDRY